MPTSSWVPIARSWLAMYQHGESAADMALCVPANTTWSRRRAHSCAYPLHVSTGPARTFGARPPKAKAIPVPITTAPSTAVIIRRRRRSRGRAVGVRGWAGATAVRSSPTPTYTRTAPPTTASTRRASAGLRITTNPATSATAARIARPAAVAGRRARIRSRPSPAVAEYGASSEAEDPGHQVTQVRVPEPTDRAAHVGVGQLGGPVAVVDHVHPEQLQGDRRDDAGSSERDPGAGRS